MADAFGNVSFSVLDSDDDACSLFPLPLMRDLGQDSLKEWLDTRVVPKNRRFADKILAQAGLTPGDTMGIIDVCLALSINDAYWVVPEGFADTFVAYNLFDNELDEALALTAYTGYPSPSTAARGFRPNGPPTASTRRPGEGSTMRSSCSKPARKGTPTPAWSPIRSSSPRRPPKHSASPRGLRSGEMAGKARFGLPAHARQGHRLRAVLARNRAVALPREPRCGGAGFPGGITSGPARSAARRPPAATCPSTRCSKWS